MSSVQIIILLIVLLGSYDARNLIYDDLEPDQDAAGEAGPERYYVYSRGDEDQDGQLVRRLFENPPRSLNPIRQQLADLVGYLRQDLASTSDRLMLRRIPQTSLNTFFDRALKIISHKRGPDPTRYRPPNVYVTKNLMMGILGSGSISNIVLKGSESLHRNGDVELQMTRQGDAFALDATIAYDRLDIEFDFTVTPIESMFGFNVTILQTEQREHVSVDYIKLHLTIIKMPDKSITLNRVTLDFSEMRRHGNQASYPGQTIANYLLGFIFSGSTMSFQFNSNNSASYGPDETFPRISGGSLFPFVILPLLL